MLFGPKISAAKSLAAEKLLKDKGINLDKDLSKFSYDGSCVDISIQVYFKSYDAGFVRGIMSPTLKEKSIQG